MELVDRHFFPARRGYREEDRSWLVGGVPGCFERGNTPLEAAKAIGRKEKFVLHEPWPDGDLAGLRPYEGEAGRYE
jgi:hypothetical protein